MAANEYTQEKKTGKFQWFVLVILIPLIFAVMLSLIVATIAGVNVFDMAQKYTKDIPVISSVIPNSDDEKSAENGSPELQAEIEDQKAQIESLEGKLTSREETIEELNQKVADLTNQLNEENKSREERSELLKKMSSSFQEMDAEQAAPIIANLDQNVAISLLENIPNQERGLIFAEMNPEQAANLTSAFVESTTSSGGTDSNNE